MKIQRVEKHVIKTSNKYYKMLDEFCFKSKNLYNFANYHVRKRFIEKGEWLKYNEMDKLFKQKEFNFDYKQMPSAGSSQQCLRVLEKNWKSFFKSIKDWQKHKDKYTGKPKLPKYLNKNGRNIVILTNAQFRLKDNIILFPKTFNGFTIKTKYDELQQIRIISNNNQITIEVVYNCEAKNKLYDNNKYIGIDIGLDNLATMTNNCKINPIILSGKKLKSINKYYNKQISHYKEIAKRMNNLDYTNKMNKLTIKRNNMVTDLIHKASKSVIEYTLSCGANTIIIGNNKDWKRECHMSKLVNQSFVGIPHQQFIQMIQYKAENVGLNVIITEESYTSGTSFLDGELPIKENYNKSRRIHRGLFISNKGIKINSDVNGSLQIIKKVFSNAFKGYEIEDLGLSPIRVGL